MCFYIHPKHKKKKIAKRDIVCYKYGNIRDGKFIPSVYPGFHYRFGEKVEQDCERWPRIICNIRKSGLGIAVIYKGFHSYSNKKMLKRQPSCYRFVKCIIPKGTEYFYNPDHKQYVSRALIVQEKIQI